eukprot:COSAG04_NODE_19962_length_404_cov_0.695082_1_plen_32_part_10
MHPSALLCTPARFLTLLGWPADINAPDPYFLD